MVDLALVQVTGDDLRGLGLPDDPESGRPMSALLPGSAVDGRLAALCGVATGSTPFRLTRPATRRSPALVLTAHRAADGDVVLQVRPSERGASAPLADRWQARFAQAPLGVVVLTLDGYVLEANQTLVDMVGRPCEDVLGAQFHSFAHPSARERLDRGELLRTGRARLEKRYRRGDGQDVWLRTATRLVVEQGERRVLSFCEDVTEVHRAQEQLVHRADHDPLTGLGNRDLLARRLRALLDEVHGGTRDGLGLLFVDLDRFKAINDTLGHAAGDRLLREVAARLQATTPYGDLLARLGGDEFALVTQQPDSAHLLGQRLVEVLQAPFVLDGREVTVGASVGVSLRRRSSVPAQRSGPPAEDAPAHDALTEDALAEGALAEEGLAEEVVAEEALLREADTAMYAAKRAGDGPVVVYDGGLQRRAVARLEDEQGLRRALQRGELRVHYQPIVRLADLRTDGVEALVRWQHPERGLLGAGAFLPTADDTGLIVPVGRFVLREACAELVRCRARGGQGRVSVNVDAQHLAAGTLEDDVAEALADSGLDASALVLEVTEQALVASHQRAAAVLGALRERGCTVALDDFGTGYSSLAYLRRLPVDVLKIDRTFVTGAGDDGHDAALLHAIAGLGASLALRTVLEGVETPAELAAARSAGVTHVQGDLLGPARPVAAAAAGA